MSKRTIKTGEHNNPASNIEITAKHLNSSEHVRNTRSGSIHADSVGCGFHLARTATLHPDYWGSSSWRLPERRKSVWQLRHSHA